jgi:hypothetical protein
MPTIVIVLLFLVVFLLAFLVVLLGPFLGLGFAMWKHSKGDVAIGSTVSSQDHTPKSNE